MSATPRPTFFPHPAALRAWFEANHDRVSEIWIAYYKRGSGRGGVTYKEAVDEALCFGWIDGQVRRIDEESYMNRYTPRNPRSIWSNVNTARFLELEKLGRVAPAGRRAFEARDSKRAGVYSFENNKEPDFDAAFGKELHRHAKAWAYFQAQPPHYRKGCAHWVMSAKQEATRTRRFAQLVADCTRGVWIKAFLIEKPRRRDPAR